MDPRHPESEDDLGPTFLDLAWWVTFTREAIASGRLTEVNFLETQAHEEQEIFRLSFTGSQI